MAWSLNNPLWASSGLALGVGILLWWYAYRSPKALIDVQQQRSLHQGKAITGAGILLFLPFSLLGLWLYPLFVPLYVVLMLSVLGYVDDRFNLSFQWRLWVQLLAAVLTLWAVQLPVAWIWLVLLVVALLWWVNLFNFMDGANGMAGFHALASLACYAYVFTEAFAPNNVLAYLTWAGLAIVVVYLWFNLVLKKLFMGDSGSLPLAWLIAVLALYAMYYDLLSHWQVAIIHAVFIVDATATLLSRIHRRENITEAHSTHLYQRLIKAGRSHGQVSGLYGLTTVVIALLVLSTQSVAIHVQYTQLFVVYGLMSVIFMKFYKLGR